MMWPLLWRTKDLGICWWKFRSPTISYPAFWPNFQHRMFKPLPQSSQRIKSVPGKIAEIIKNKPKLQSFASEIMTFLRKYHLGGAKMIGQRAALVRLYFPVESLGQKRRNTFCVTQHFITNTHALHFLLPSPFPYFIFPKQMWKKCLNIFVGWKKILVNFFALSKFPKCHFHWL